MRFSPIVRTLSEVRCKCAIKKAPLKRNPQKTPGPECFQSCKIYLAASTNLCFCSSVDGAIILGKRSKLTEPNQKKKKAEPNSCKQVGRHSENFITTAARVRKHCSCIHTVPARRSVIAGTFSRGPRTRRCNKNRLNDIYLIDFLERARTLRVASYQSRPMGWENMRIRARTVSHKSVARCRDRRWRRGEHTVQPEAAGAAAQSKSNEINVGQVYVTSAAIPGR